MQFIFPIVFIVVFLFGFVIFFGAPYVPTLSRQKEAALKELNLKPGQKLYELGCGDGRVLLAAAHEGYMTVGYEINPLLAFISWWRTRKFRTLIKVRWGNFWRADLHDADAVFVFLLDKYMPKLDTKLKALKRPLKLASVAFEIKGKKAIKKVDGVFLYQY